MAKHIIIGFRRYHFDLANITVEPVLFLYMFASFLYFPTIQALIFHKVCLHSFNTTFCEVLEYNTTFKHDHQKENDFVTSETSYWILKITLALTLPSFFMVIFFLGSLGDVIGRKVPVILPCLGAFAAYLSGLLNAKYESASLYYILIGPLLNGFSGGYIACLMSVYSYVGHITTPDTKLTRMGIVEAMIFIAGTIGVFTSGLMIDNQGYVFTFSVMCVTIGLAVIYSALWLDNVHSYNDIQERPGFCSMLFRFLRESFQCVVMPRSRRVGAALVLMILALNLLMLCTTGDMDIAMLYMRKTLNFSPTTFGFMKGLDYFLRGLIMLTFVPLMRHKVKLKEMILVLLGLFSYAAEFVITGAARTQWLVFLGVVIGMFKGIPSAGLRATMSSLITKNEQGRLFGIIAASESITSLLSTLLFNELYPATYDLYPGFCYMLAAGILVIAFFIVLSLHCFILQNISSNYRPMECPSSNDEEENATDG
uniref:Major facilitator superfamily (MFS) profile domain-containing protein n=1 Tax=Biomphalaria glabrata TaxID=6526 RepID=A0A2C9LBU5_BIOGL